MERRAGIYARISLDRTGEGLGVQRQLADCRRKAESLGWVVTEEYVDNDISASVGQPRSGYRRLLQDLSDGRIDAVIAWQMDRLCRRTSELAGVLDLLEQRRAVLATVSGDVDPSSASGRLVLELLGSVAQHEVRLKGERQRLANEQRARRGVFLVGGRRLFGYDNAGVVVAQEAVTLREAAQAFLAGDSLRSVCRMLNERNARTTADGPWRPTELRRTLANPRLAGLSAYRGQVIGTGQWTAILDEDTHRSIVAILADPARRRAGRPRAYLLSGFGRCAVCGARLFGSADPRRPGGIYRCETRQHVHRRADHLDDFVRDLVVGRLARPDAARLFADAQAPTNQPPLQVEDARLRAKLADLAAAYASDAITLDQLTTATARVRGDLERLSAALAAAAGQADLTPLLTADDVGATWDSLPLSRRRRVVDHLMIIGVRPPGRGARVFDPDSVEVAWRR